MRKLGHILGVEAMSLYRHVANKDDILDGMVGLVMTEIELPWKRTSARMKTIKARLSEASTTAAT